MIPKKADAISALVSGPITAATDGSYVVYHNGQTPPTEEKINAKFQELRAAEPMRLLRQERNRKLAETDWMANSDVTMGPAWKGYRQQLRDLPANYTTTDSQPLQEDLSNLEWPTKPQERYANK